MKVYVEDGRQLRSIGRAEVEEDEGPILRIPLFGAVSTLVECFALEDVAHREPDGRPAVERAVIMSCEQRPELLPGWAPLAS